LLNAMKHRKVGTSSYLVDPCWYSFS
jgi:hypothetical protein